MNICKNNLKIYLIIALISIQFYDAYSSELYSRIQSLYIEEFLISGEGMPVNEAMAHLSKIMLPCYLFIMLAPACRTLADRFGRKKLLMVSIIGILLGSGICAYSSSIYIFLFGNMILNFSNSLDIQQFYIIEEIPKKHHGKIRGVTGGIAALAAISIPLLRSVFVKDIYEGWRSLYLIVILVGIVMFVMACFFPETSEYKATSKATTVSIKQLVKDYKQIWFEKKLHLLLLFVYGIATAGITFYNEPLLSFAGFSESLVEKILVIQPVVCCVVLMMGGRMADRYGWKRVIVGMIIIAMLGCIGFICFRGNTELWFLVGLCYGIMLGGYWSAYHLLELLLIRDCAVHRRGEQSAILTYINGIGNAIGIGLFTIFLQMISMYSIKLILVIPTLLATILLLRKTNIKEC